MAIIGTYVLTDSRTKRFYLGSTKDVKKRIKRHFSDLEAGIHHCKPFQNIWSKGNSVLITIYEFETRDEAYALEQQLINQYKDSTLLLNVGLGVRGGDNISRNPNRDKIIEKMKASLVERFSSLTAYERKLIYGKPGALNGMYGKTHTPETCAKISAINIGKAYSRGRKFSQEHREKISINAKLRIGDKNPFYGKKHSEETKKKLSMRFKGQPGLCNLPVSINGKVFRSMAEAGKTLNIPVPTISFRVKSPNPKFINYFLVTKMPND